jgi:predicted O-linked N-acetylglucosamine transferase (SPINDLY family)
MLSQFGLTEFIADSKEMFLEKAIEWAHKPDKLNAIRSGLRDTLSLHPAVTSHTVNRAFETAIRRVWQRACDGLPPESFDITGNSAD